MNRSRNFQRLVLLGLAFSLAAVLFAQGPSDKKLLVNGKNTGVTVLQADGRFYVDVETLARITRGTVTVEPTQVVLTIPRANSDVSSSSPQTEDELSKEFVSAAIVALAEMREWKGALATMITYGLAVDGLWAQTYREQAETSLTQASLAVSTNGDRSALQLLSNEFGHLAKWESSVLEDRRTLNGAETVYANGLQDDPELAKISSCGRFLSKMLISRTFADNSTCE
jgi:hypothetical protein